jgi:hypothetical protein
MNTFTCDLCKYETTYSSNWSKHVKSKKHLHSLKEHKLLNIIDKLVNDKNKQKSFPCKYCGREYTRNHNLKKHQDSCQNKENVQSEVLKLLDTLKVNTTNMKNTNIMGDLPPVTENLKMYLEKLTITFIQDGAKGYAEYANNYALKNCLICTDKSRKKLKFKSDNGNIITDVGGIKLSQLFFDSIKDKNKEIINAEYNLLQKQVEMIGIGTPTTDQDLCELLYRSTMLQSLLYECNQAASGKINNLTQSFVKNLTRLL